MMRPPSVTDVEAAQSHLVLLKSKMRQRRQQADNRIGVLVGSKKNMGMDQYLLIPFLVGYSHPFTSYFDVSYRGTIGFDTLPYWKNRGKNWRILGGLRIAGEF